jgi:uncharacterized MAPEG superfamily protein
MNVGKARETYGIKAPAISGNENFERYYRVQMNTLELLICFIPSLLISSLFWSPLVMAIIGLIFFIGRFIYFKQYVANPEKRTVGFALSILPVFILLIAIIAGIVKSNL